MEVHRAPWQALPTTEQTLAQLREQLDLATGELRHLHIQGPPGVGKSRFALELCRGAAWQGSVIYFQNGSDFRLAEIIQTAVSEPGVRLMVVADEIPTDQLTFLRDSLDGGEGRVRLITIGHGNSPDPTRIPTQPVLPLEPEQMRGVVCAWHPAMLREYVDFVIRFSDGFIRLARLAADAVAKDPSVDVRQLLSLHGIRGFLDQMLGTENRKHLYVVAVLSSVGWTGDVQVEGEAIARLFGWPWNDVRASVEEFHRRFGIAPRGGRYRYISPKPLAIYLAVEAWNTFPDLLKRLPSELPTEGSIRAYDDRLQTIASNPQAKQFSSEQLRVFFSIEQLIDARSANRWSAFAAADPALAAKQIARILEREEIASRLKIIGEARRTIVWTLVRLAWKPAAFHDAVLALAFLAEAENETWNNNATGEFRARFSVLLGGTSLDYSSRLTVIDRLISLNRPTLLKLAAAALSVVGSDHGSRMETSNLGDEPRQPEWRPATGGENLECVEQATARLTVIASLPTADIAAELVAAADNLAMLLRPAQTRPLVLKFYEAVRKTYPQTREPFRRIIESILHREKEIWKELGTNDIRELEEAHTAFEDSSLPARLQQYVGQASFIKSEQPDLHPLADELLLDPSLLATHWPWLTSGQAADGWRLGSILGTRDTTGALEGIFGVLANRGPDLRMLSGYVSGRLQAAGRDWFDEWISAQMRRDPDDFQLLFEVTARTNPTVKAAQLLEAALRTGKVDPRMVGQLAYGNWSAEIPIDVLKDLLTTLADSGYEETALAILFQRMRNMPVEVNAWDDLALRFVTTPKLIRSGNMVNFYWETVADHIAPRHAPQLAMAIFAAQADRESRWMAEFSGAKKVILHLIEFDAAGVWEALKPHLESRADALMFTIGFPRSVIDKVPTANVLDWISEKPEERASIVAHLVGKDFSTDETLASQVIGKFGHLEPVSSSFFSNLISGMFSGAASAHWTALSTQLLQVSARTRLPQLKFWTDNAAESLKRMAEQEKQQEEEEQLRSS
jgi:hypothetical protein